MSAASGGRAPLTCALPFPHASSSAATRDDAVIDLGGVRKVISLALVPDAVPGDYVIVHVGYALSKLDPEEAQRTLELFASAGLVAQDGA